MIDTILEELIASVPGGRAAVFLDGEGEFIGVAGDRSIDIQLIGAWKEIQLDRIKEIANKLGLGGVQAVLFSVDEGTELVVPVLDEYCLLLFLSSYADVRDALVKIKTAIEKLQQDIA